MWSKLFETRENTEHADDIITVIQLNQHVKRLRALRGGFPFRSVLKLFGGAKRSVSKMPPVLHILYLVNPGRHKPRHARWLFFIFSPVLTNTNTYVI